MSPSLRFIPANPAYDAYGNGSTCLTLVVAFMCGASLAAERTVAYETPGADIKNDDQSETGKKQRTDRDRMI